MKPSTCRPGRASLRSVRCSYRRCRCRGRHGRRRPLRSAGSAPDPAGRGWLGRARGDFVARSVPPGSRPPRGNWSGSPHHSWRWSRDVSRSKTPRAARAKFSWTGGGIRGAAHTPALSSTRTTNGPMVTPRDPEVPILNRRTVGIIDLCRPGSGRRLRLPAKSWLPTASRRGGSGYRQVSPTAAATSTLSRAGSTVGSSRSRSRSSTSPRPIDVTREQIEHQLPDADTVLRIIQHS